MATVCVQPLTITVKDRNRPIGARRKGCVMEVTERNCLRIRLSDDEAMAVIQACDPARPLPLRFGIEGTFLLCLPRTRWAVEAVSRVRDVDLRLLAVSAGDRGVAATSG
jgi:hypothetical protein